MKKILFVLTLIAVCLVADAKRPRVVVDVKDRDSTQRRSTFQYHAATDSSGARLTIDSGELVYQMKIDSINQWAEEKIREQIIRIERKFEDPKVEEETGKLIGQIIMQQQMAMLDLQVERALSFKDTLLLFGLKTALQEMVLKNPEVQEELRKLIDKVEAEFDKHVIVIE